jgi:hypothetical protein
MTKDCQLYLEAGQMTAWRREKGQLTQIASFADTPDGEDGFSAFLAVHRKTRFSLLVNLPDENFVLESLPRLRASERKQLLATKVRRLFPDTPWLCTTRSNSGKNDETAFLLMALGKSPALSRWEARLKAANSAVDGVHSLPQLLPVLLKKSASDTQSLLTLSLHDDYARFSLLIHGCLRASRLTQLTGNSTLPDEYRRFIDYIARQCSLEPGIPLCVIGDAERQSQIDLPNVVNRIITPERNCASIFLSVPHRHWPPEQFAPPALRQQGRQQRQIDWLWRSATLALLLGSSISLERLYRYENARKALDAEREQHRIIDSALQQNNQMLAGSRLNRKQLQQLARDYPILLRNADAFEESLHSLSRILDESPAIQLDRIDWKIDSFPPSTVTMQLDAQVKKGNGTFVGTAFRNFHERLKQAPAITLTESPISAPTSADLPFTLKLSMQHKP